MHVEGLSNRLAEACFEIAGKPQPRSIENGASGLRDINVALNHLTSYKYDRPMATSLRRLSDCVLRRTAAPACCHYSLRVLPKPHFINWQQDPQSNYLCPPGLPGKGHRVQRRGGPGGRDVGHQPSTSSWSRGPNFPLAYDEVPSVERPSLAKRRCRRWGRIRLASISREKCAAWIFWWRSTSDLQPHRLPDPGAGRADAEETLTWRTGSCRDSAWLLVQLLRHLWGCRALRVRLPDPAQAPRREIAGRPLGHRSRLHRPARLDRGLSARRRLGRLDPTSGLFAGEGHIPAGLLARPRPAAPITGFIDECECEFEHHMNVPAIWEAPRVTKPYHRGAVGAIEALGHRIDGPEAHDVRLTMGGEPTFVSIDDPDGAEWNTDAMGPRQAPRRGPCSGACATNTPRRPAALRAGQSGIPASSCRAGR